MNSDPDALVLQASWAGGVRVLTLNRPKALNSFTRDMLKALHVALDDAANDPSVRGVVIAGAGRAFCAGQDLSDPGVAPDLTPGATPKDIGEHIMGSYQPMLMRLRSMPVPTLAMVHGVAAGAGANVALGCDIVVAGKSASFLQAFTKIALVPDCGGSWLLPRLVGRANALGLAMLADKLTAEDAQRMGLIWLCVEDDALLPRVQALAQQLAAMPTNALVQARALIDHGMAVDYASAVAAEAAAQRKLGQAGDYREGVRAFMEKRTPVFKDRAHQPPAVGDVA